MGYRAVQSREGTEDWGGRNDWGGDEDMRLTDHPSREGNAGSGCSARGTIVDSGHNVTSSCTSHLVRHSNSTCAHCSLGGVGPTPGSPSTNKTLSLLFNMQSGL